jgi:hypothetical protein
MSPKLNITKNGREQPLASKYVLIIVFFHARLDGKHEISFVCLFLRDECTDHEIELMEETRFPVEFGTMHLR